MPFKMAEMTLMEKNAPIVVLEWLVFVPSPYIRASWELRRSSVRPVQAFSEALVELQADLILLFGQQARVLNDTFIEMQF